MQNSAVRADLSLLGLPPQGRVPLRSAFADKIKYYYVVEDAIFPEDQQLRTPHDPEYPSQFVDGFKHAVVLMAALVVGPSVDRLREFTGYPADFLAEIDQRMRAAELWVGDEVRCTHWNFDNTAEYISDGFNDFWLDVAVARGLVLRLRDAEGKYRYFEKQTSGFNSTSAGSWARGRW